MLLDGAEGDDGLENLVREHLALFYADDGLIGGPDPEWVQTAFSLMIRLFERIRLKTNLGKTKSMTCVPGYIRGQMSSPAYRRSRGGEGESYKERKRRAVTCPQCDKNLKAGSLARHLQQVHGVAVEPTTAP